MTLISGCGGSYQAAKSEVNLAAARPVDPLARVASDLLPQSSGPVAFEPHIFDAIATGAEYRLARLSSTVGQSSVDRSTRVRTEFIFHELSQRKS